MLSIILEHMSKYIRDGRSPQPKKEATSKVMSANRGKDTGPERLLRAALREVGVPGYRLHWKKAPGRPDIAYPGRKLAIFVHGCFWHRCPHCHLPMPKTNVTFWEEKFRRNRERDARKVTELEDAGWRVMVVWECEIKKDVKGTAKRVKKLITAK